MRAVEKYRQPSYFDFQCSCGRRFRHFWRELQSAVEVVELVSQPQVKIARLQALARRDKQKRTSPIIASMTQDR